LSGSQRLRRASWAIWLAVLALGLEALVPIHLALDLDEAVASGHRSAPGADRHSFEWRFLAIAAGHVDADGRPERDRHGPACPAVAAIGVLSGFAIVAPPALPATAVVAALPSFAVMVGEPGRAPAAGYRSRAPPLG
jgi:hypothetical protein